MIETFSTIDEMKAAVAIANAADTEAERIQRLCGIALEPKNVGLNEIDPFSDDYRRLVMSIYREISGRDGYSPSEHELAPYLDEAPATRPNYYSAGNTSWAGEVLKAMGGVLQVLNLAPGQKLLEYGAGEGGIALEAAKCGVDVTVVDVEARYLKLIDRRAAMAETNIRTICGEFGYDAGQFDVVLFYEAFHHCLDHLQVARSILGMLRPGGRLILAGEPVIGAHNEQWRSSVPYPWGLRMDGLSFRAIQTYGWLELGYDHDYLMKMLARAGYNVEFRLAPHNERASCYIATPQNIL